MREYLLVLLVAAGVTYLLSNLARRLAFRFNAVALVRDRDVHTRPIPYFGGISMCLGLAAAFLVSGQLPWLGGFESVRHDAQAILLAGTLICAVGVVDDLLELNAIAKIAGQLLAAGVVVMNGVKLYWIPLPDAILSLDDGASIAITVVLIFVAVNAINLIDGLDGLAAGVVAIGSGAFFLYAYLLAYEQELVRATPASLVTVATLGICLGFLPYNVHPARMFMGDSGAMLLGFLMATSSISLTGQLDPSRLQTAGVSVLATYLPILLPFAVLAFPLLDLTMAYVRRTLRGQMWYQADKQHLHHRMLNLGHPHRQAVALLWLWSALVAFGVVLVALYPQPGVIAGFVAGLVVAAGLTWGRRVWTVLTRRTKVDHG
ncbi:MAG: MraY family glycosyltransferase [Propionicimonas sp.]|uniref:MraY family glycosyltransferase n=1 Tax=Propionicimonas sp. TaxID=1955623 RepID=UPI002B212871|nr:MraY family glycosyltransferase [Propionicimonas sp.]MEA4943149.1 MraY family glycosyltransferase [Propionicimonas sp.]MEA5053223.1 MraY family glycosyltransferase [Propionicimonas sp.]